MSTPRSPSSTPRRSARAAAAAAADDSPTRASQTASTSAAASRARPTPPSRASASSSSAAVGDGGGVGPRSGSRDPGAAATTRAAASTPTPTATPSGPSQQPPRGRAPTTTTMTTTPAAAAAAAGPRTTGAAGREAKEQAERERLQRALRQVEAEVATLRERLAQARREWRRTSQPPPTKPAPPPPPPPGPPSTREEEQGERRGGGADGNEDDDGSNEELEDDVEAHKALQLALREIDDAALAAILAAPSASLRRLLGDNLHGVAPPALSAGIEGLGSAYEQDALLAGLRRGTLGRGVDSDRKGDSSSSAAVAGQKRKRASASRAAATTAQAGQDGASSTSGLGQATELAGKPSGGGRDGQEDDVIEAEEEERALLHVLSRRKERAERLVAQLSSFTNFELERVSHPRPPRNRADGGAGSGSGRELRLRGWLRMPDELHLASSREPIQVSFRVVEASEAVDVRAGGSRIEALQVEVDEVLKEALNHDGWWDRKVGEVNLPAITTALRQLPVYALARSRLFDSLAHHYPRLCPSHLERLQRLGRDGQGPSNLPAQDSPRRPGTQGRGRSRPSRTGGGGAAGGGGGGDATTGDHDDDERTRTDEDRQRKRDLLVPPHAEKLRFANERGAALELAFAVRFNEYGYAQTSLSLRVAELPARVPSSARRKLELLDVELKRMLSHAAVPGASRPGIGRRSATKPGRSGGGAAGKARSAAAVTTDTGGATTSVSPRDGSQEGGDGDDDDGRARPRGARGDAGDDDGDDDERGEGTTDSDDSDDEEGEGGDGGRGGKGGAGGTAATTAVLRCVVDAFFGLGGD